MVYFVYVVKFMLKPWKTLAERAGFQNLLRQWVVERFFAGIDRSRRPASSLPGR